MTSTTDPSPSHARRKALREADQGRAVMTVINTFPIEKYYDALERLYNVFSVAMDERRLDDAYVLGIRFATFSIESLPKHCSYKQKQYTTLRLRNAQRVEEVLQKIESVAERMDAEEKVKQQSRKQEQLIKEEEKRKKQEEKEKRQILEKTKKERQEIEQSALAKLDAMVQTRKKQEKEKEESKQKRADAARKKQEEAKKWEEAEAQKLARQQREQAAHHNEKESSIISKTPRRHYEEERVIELLQKTIASQEEHIKVIQEVKIPALLRKAKSKLAAGQRKEAICCVYHKRKWDNNVDVLKAGIFKMETQILHLESAAEDREVAKILQAATDAMQTIQADVSGVDVDDMNRVMAELAKGVEHNFMFDEDELLSELEESTSSSFIDQEVSVLPGSQDLLSLPSVPSADMPDVKEPKQGLLKPSLA